jgi:predicted nucleic acid-binding protein
MDVVILDTDLLSEVIKRKDRKVLANAQHYLEQHGRLAFSAISMYEIMRGMLANRATKQFAGFLQVVNTSDVFPVSTPVLRRAAELWADGHRGGHARNDADLIIAATALENSRVLITGNTSHFDWVPGLKLSDWRTV